MEVSQMKEMYSCSDLYLQLLSAKNRQRDRDGTRKVQKEEERNKKDSNKIVVERERQKQVENYSMSK